MTSIWFQAHHVEHAATVAGTWVMAAFSNVVSSYRIRIACTGGRTAHMRLDSSAQPRIRPLTAGLPLWSESQNENGRAYLGGSAPTRQFALLSTTYWPATLHAPSPTRGSIEPTTSTVVLTTGIPSGPEGRGLFFRFIADTKSKRTNI
jgi:hypothetical protein